MSSISGVVLHTGQGLTLGEYLLRVIFHLLAVVGIGVTVHWCVRAFETIRSENGR
jgi:recombinational DNA repair protein (RecF pathway)